jgi:hypothetical protein
MWPKSSLFWQFLAFAYTNAQALSTVAIGPNGPVFLHKKRTR